MIGGGAVFSRPSWRVRWLVRGVLRVFGVKTDPDSHILAVREEIVGALQLGHSEGVVEKEDRDRILGALDLGDRTVEEIMLHRSGIEMIDADAAAARDPRAMPEILSHTRLPVFRDDPENIIGVIHAKDLLRAMYALATDDGMATMRSKASTSPTWR
jgi:Mg2+/Co2+ transporter CorB